MSRAKLLAAVVVVLAVLFFVGVGAGATRRAAGPPAAGTGAGSPIDQLKMKVTAKDLTAPCLDAARGELTIAAGQSCRVAVPPSWYPLRRLTLRLKMGSTAAATLTQKGALANRQSLTAGGTAALDVYKELATLQLSCAANCVLEVK